MIEEVWRDVKNFPGYQVSNKGQIRSYKTGFFRPLKLSAQGSKKYFTVSLYNEVG